MFKCTLPRPCLVSANGLRQDALGGRLTECEGALSIPITCLAHQSAPMTVFLKRSAGSASGGLKGVVAVMAHITKKRRIVGSVNYFGITLAVGTM